MFRRRKIASGGLPFLSMRCWSQPLCCLCFASRSQGQIQKFGQNQSYITWNGACIPVPLATVPITQKTVIAALTQNEPYAPLADDPLRQAAEVLAQKATYSRLMAAEMTFMNPSIRN